jgi:clan AA aspartic protease
MRGTVHNLHALLPVIFRLPGQPDLTIEFVIDTGFTGALTLPLVAITALKLPFLHRIPADLADSSTVELDVYAASIVWQGVEKTVRVLSARRRPLLGTELLDGTELNICFIEAGRVTVSDKLASEQ